MSNLNYLKKLLADAARAHGTGGNIPDSPDVTVRPRSVTPAIKLNARQRDFGQKGLTPENEPIVSPIDNPYEISPTMKPLTPGGGAAERQRELSPATPQEKLQDEHDWIQADESHGRGGSVIAKPSRWKGALINFLQNAGARADVALATRQTGWGGVAQALGGGVGGGIAGAVDPNIIVRARHEVAKAENQQDIDQTFLNQKHQAEIDTLGVNAENKRSLMKNRDRTASVKEATEKRRQGHEDWNQVFMEDRKTIEERYKAGLISLATKRLQIAQADSDERSAHNVVMEGQGQQRADSYEKIADRGPASAVGSEALATSAMTEAQKTQTEIDAIVESQKTGGATTKPVIDKTTGQPATNAKGEIVYGNTPTEAYKEGQARIKVLKSHQVKLQDEERKARAKGGSSTGQGGSTYAPAKLPYSVSAAVKSGLTLAEAKAKAARAVASGKYYEAP